MVVNGPEILTLRNDLGKGPFILTLFIYLFTCCSGGEANMADKDLHFTSLLIIRDIENSIMSNKICEFIDITSK